MFCAINKGVKPYAVHFQYGRFIIFSKALALSVDMHKAQRQGEIEERGRFTLKHVQPR